MAHRLRGTLLPLLAAIALLCLATSAPAQDIQPRPGDTVEDYIVKSGETLRGLTKRHLGDPEMWRENWRVNPGLTSPHKLSPGQQIRLIVNRAGPKMVDATAVVRKVQRRVEEQQPPSDWAPSREGNELGERDSMRTYKGASAELVFDDGAEFTLTEDSLIVLREVATSEGGAGRETIEVVAGQADSVARSRVRGGSEIEIVMGDVVARPKPDSLGNTSSRVKKQDDGGSQLMVYTGQAKVAAGGAEVAVGRGMGTSIKEGEAPGEPEKLLPAPALVEPTDKKRVDWANPLLVWSEVEGAASYAVEVYADPDCKELNARAAGVTGTSWRPSSLGPGTWYWRATATAASRLDGYPSAPRTVEVTNPYPDRRPPQALIQRRGLNWERPGRTSERAVRGSVQLAESSADRSLPARVAVREGQPLVIIAKDDRSGVRRLSYRWGDERWTDIELPKYRLARITLEPDQTGILEVKVRDRAGWEAIWRAEIVTWPGDDTLPDVQIDLTGG